MCGPNAAPPNATACVGPDWTKNVVLPTPQNPAPVLADIDAGRLPSVSWVIPKGRESDHTQVNDGSGPSWVASVVNAIGNSPYWSNTVILITWDDWGGWYDHVAPPQILNAYEYGFRVPLIVVSPYAKPAHISHVTHDFGSILKFVEEDIQFAIVGLCGCPRRRSLRLFQFRAEANSIRVIEAPIKAEHFLNDTRPPTEPDDD